MYVFIDVFYVSVNLTLYKVAMKKLMANACAGVARKMVEESFEKLVKLKVVYKYCKGGYELYQFFDGVIYNLVYDGVDPEERR